MIFKIPPRPNTTRYNSNTSATARLITVGFGEETGRTPKTNNICNQSKASHECNWEGVKNLDQGTVDIKRKINEAVHIRRQRPTLNRDGGYELPPNFNHLLSHD